MKNMLILTTLAGAWLVTGAGSAIADEHEKKKGAVTGCVSAEHAQGSDLWDFNGNKIGTIEKVLLTPSSSHAFVVVDAGEMLGDDRRLAIPWESLHVKHKDTDSDEIVYTLDATKAKLTAAPMWKDEDADAFDGRMARTYWGVREVDLDVDDDDRTDRTDRTDAIRRDREDRDPVRTPE